VTHFHLGIKAAGGGLTTLTGWTSNGHRRRVYPCPGKRADASSILTKSNALTLACAKKVGEAASSYFMVEMARCNRRDPPVDEEPHVEART